VNCLFIGPLANHSVVGRVAALSAAGANVGMVAAGDHDAPWVNDAYPIVGARLLDHWRDPYYGSASRQRRVAAEFGRTLGVVPEDRRIAKSLRNLLTHYRPNLAVVHYGSIAIHYLRILRRLAPHLPIIDIPNVLPSHLSYAGRPRGRLPWGLSGIEDLSYSRWLPAVDGIVFASQEMQSYALGRYRISQIPSCVMPDYLPMAFQMKLHGPVTTFVESFSGDPHVAFLGAPERYGRVIDALDQQFLEMARMRIHVHSATLSEAVLRTGFGHVYPHCSDEQVFRGELATCLSGLDAAVVTYNERSRHERFRSTYPTRFFSSISCGLPVAVRAGSLDACERFVTEHGIGFVYLDADDLRRKLEDRDFLASCRATLRAQLHSMSAESQGEELRRFIARAILWARGSRDN